MINRIITVFIFIFLVATQITAQNCNIISRANDILPDRLCSPVTVNWEVSYRGVNDAGSLVQIQFDWNDGSTSVIDAVNSDPDPMIREWSIVTNHTYTSDDDKCNYRPVATLIVDGQVCSSSSQEQIVTVWDNDNSNGGKLLIDPPVYPICIGNGANVQFQDNTLFNCVPPQENDVPNLDTRWIQWIYGTNISMTGIPVRIDGALQAFPFSGSIITLTGPVTGSGELSQIINVANDKLIGQSFEVELRYWNYCNPYDDPAIPGPPADLINGDHTPETTTAHIIIVDIPDATIDFVNPVCLDRDTFLLSAATPGGIWSGLGIVNSNSGAFLAAEAGIGSHTIHYDITDGNNCSDSDFIQISVMPSPDASIKQENPFCITGSIVDLEAASSLGTWIGDGIIDSSTGLFDPGAAGIGEHIIQFITDADVNGCIGEDTTLLIVNDIPNAAFISKNKKWCSLNDNTTEAKLLLDLNSGIEYELIWEANGVIDTITGIHSDTLKLTLDNQNGENVYKLLKITEKYGSVSCERILNDSLVNTVYAIPELNLLSNPNGLCSPVSVEFTSTSGFEKYSWNFGNGEFKKTKDFMVRHSFAKSGKNDTIYTVILHAETSDGCIDSSSFDVKVYPNPKADFFVSPQIQYYPNSTVQLSNLSDIGDWSYLWGFGDGENDTLRQPIEYDYDNYGVFDIKLDVYSEFCRDSIIKQVQILPPIPEAGFTPDTAGCPPMEITFRNHSKYGESYIWDFDDGTFSTEKNPTHLFYQPKIHNVSLKVKGLSGEDTEKHTVTVFVYPQALFNAYPAEANSVDQLIKFVNNSQNATRYFWDFGDGESSQEINPYHVYGKEGKFNVSLYTWSVDNCVDTLIREKYINIMAGEGIINYPNAFRWNGSGPNGGYWTDGEIDNTIFHPHFVNVVEYQLYIYNRWGELIYESEDIHKGWDGYIKNGKKAGQGVYVYKAVVRYIDGEQEIRVGDVTFLH